MIILLIGSCKNSVNEDKGLQLIESVISDIQLIKENYANCLSNIKVGDKTTNFCKDEIAEIKFLHKKTKRTLLALAKLRNKGVLSNEAYNSYIERMDQEFKVVRDLSHQLKEKGVSIDLK